MTFRKLIIPCLLALMILFAGAPPALAQDAPPADPASASLETRVAAIEAYFNNGAPEGSLEDVPGPGHNAWMMVSSALVLFMTLPGLALFYGGLVRRKNVLSILAQCFGIAGMVTLLWWAVGYSLVFGGSFESPFIGGTEHFFLKGVGPEPNDGFGAWVSHNVFAMFQMMFAIITPALIVGAIAERMKFSAIMLFVFGWMFLVYFPMAHMTWGGNGFMNGVWNDQAGIKAIDFAGGTVVHMTSGWSALVLCMILGKRLGYGTTKMAPHSMVLCMVGTGMLWVGWYGFNAGSAVAADGIAANAFVTTTLAAAVASFTWAGIEYVTKGKASVLGFCSGAVGGLVVITPAAGFVTATSSVILGAAAGVVTFLGCTKLKHMFGYDDALDTFGVHAVGGTLGALLTGIFASAEANPNLSGNLADYLGRTLWIEQLKSMVLTIVIAVVGSLILAMIVKSVVGLRPTPEVEETGLDVNEHGEEGYAI